MGNASSRNNKKNATLRKTPKGIWSKKANLEFHKRSYGKILAIDSCKIDDENILVASMCQGGIVVISKLCIQEKNKIQSRKIAEIRMLKGSHTSSLLTIKLSSTSSDSIWNIACTGTDNLCRIFQIDLNTETNIDIISNKDSKYITLDAENKALGCVTDIKFVCDTKLLTSYANGSLLLWNIANRNKIESIKINIDSAVDDILSIDYININNKNIVAFVGGQNGQKIYFKDLTYLIQENEETFVVESSIDFIDYGLNVNIEFITFSKNGKFIAAIADNGCYCIYSFTSNLNHIHWNFVSKKKMEKINGQVFMTCVNQTVMAVTDFVNSNIYATQVTEIECDMKVKDAIAKCVIDIIKPISGDISDICDVIELYLTEFQILDYNFESNIDSRIVSFASCEFGQNDQHSIIFTGNKQVHCIL
eukprot:201177_1